MKIKNGFGAETFWLHALITVKCSTAVRDFAFFRYFEMTESKEGMWKEQAWDDDDVIIIAISAGLGRGMEGQWDTEADEIFMRSSCWGEAGLHGAVAPASQ